MTNLLEQAINCDDGDRAAKIIQEELAGRSRAALDRRTNSGSLAMFTAIRRASSRYFPTLTDASVTIATPFGRYR